MSPEDRDTLISLRRQQAELHQMLERLGTQLHAIEARTGVRAIELFLPPVPPEAFLPPVPPAASEVQLPPIPAEAGLPLLPSLPTTVRPAPPAPPPPPVQSSATHWLLRIGVATGLFFLLLLGVGVDAVFHVHRWVGPLGCFGIAGFAGMAVLLIGERFDTAARRSLFGKVLLALGLVGLFLAFHEASALVLSGKVPHSVLGGLFMLVWTLYAFFVAERHKSQFLAVTALLFGYLSMSLVPAAWFSLGMDLILAAGAAAFLMWRCWTVLATLGMLGAYLALFRRLIFDSYGDLVLDTSRTLPFLPPAVYLLFTWIFFTAAIILCTAPAFRGMKRFLLASLNNAGLVFLIALTAYISGYGLGSIGWSLLDTGVLFLIVSRFAGFAEQDPVDLMGIYAAQGLGVFTLGIAVAFTGITRAVLLLLETLLFGIAGAFAGDRVLIVATYAAGFFAAVFSIWQIALYAHHPWLLGFGGALIMLINAWSSRGDVRHSPIARSHTVFSTSCYCLLALGLIFTALSTVMTDASLPVALAISALVLTFAIYQFSIFELPSVAQILMLGALFLVLFPTETGEQLPVFTTLFVGLATLGMLTWWSRQGIMLPGAWLGPVTYAYSLGLVYLAVLCLRPWLDAQNWMVAECFLSIAFLLYGMVTRVWPLAISGQVLLLLALYHVFFPPQTNPYSWSGVAAAIPIVVTFFTARAADRWLHLFPELSPSTRAATSFFVTLYQFIALLGVIRWTLAIVPFTEHFAAFVLIGVFLLAHNSRHPHSLGLRSGLLLSALAMCVYVTHAHHLTSALSAFAVILFLAAVPLLANSRWLLISRVESWVFTLAAVFTAWYFLSVWAWPHAHGVHSRLSLVWALYALVLFIFGLLCRLPRLRWCGLFVLGVTMLRVLCIDLWSLSLVLRVITLLLLVTIVMGIGLSFAFVKLNESQQRPKNL